MDTIAYVDQARPGQENMAIDRELLEAAERTGSAYVRLYRWSEPTLSLGHFQAGIDRNLHAASRNLPVVLRASGGGAIVHDREWTYSIAMPVGRNKIGASKELYDIVHDALVVGLRTLGWSASQWTKPCAVEMTETSSAKDTGMIACGGSKPTEPLLCFQRRSCGDIVCEGFKVVGSAQRRLGASVLQHGSILCQRSPFAPELPGLIDLPRTFRGELLNPSGVPQTSVIHSLSEDSPIDMETFGSLVLSWVLNPLEQTFGCRPVLSRPPIFCQIHHPSAAAGSDLADDCGTNSQR